MLVSLGYHQQLKKVFTLTRPGEYAIWKAEGVATNVIVQSVNAAERTANALVVDTGAIEFVSLLELDRGESDPLGHAPNLTDTLGVNRNDLVLIHRPGTTNGCAKSRVPRIGEIEPWLREVPANGHCSAWRREMAELGAQVSKSRGASVEPLSCKRPTPEDDSFHWFGEVITVSAGFTLVLSLVEPRSDLSFLQLNYDGTVVVAHADSTLKTYSVERLTALADGLDTLQELDFQEAASPHGQSADGEDLYMMEDGEWRAVSTLDSEDGWEDEDDIQPDDTMMDVDASHTINGNGAVDLDAMDIDDLGDPGPSQPIMSPSSPSQDSVWSELAEGAAVTNNIPIDGVGNPTHMIYSPPSTTPSSPRRGSTLPPPMSGTNSSLLKEYVFRDTMENGAGPSNVVASVNQVEKSEPAEVPWKRFDILPAAPGDHAFYSEQPAQPGKSFMARLNREYRALASSLPGLLLL
jgi:ubiquitin-conjugating enzyme E2 O